MRPIIAHATLKAISDALERDQGASYRGWLAKVLPHIGDAYRTEDDGFRSHMGGSLIGRECAREIWYGFRWTTKPKFPGRVLRLFNRGHLEEGRFIALLLMIGCEVYQQDENGKQFRISHAGGHFGGSGDGVVIGIPDLPAGTTALAEFKTHNDKSFKELVSKGVRDAKFEHFVQMQVYLRKMGLAVALYVAVNKNDDDLYAEIIHLDSAVADQFLDRGQNLVFMRSPPKKINESPGFYKCKFCDHNKVCHLKKAPEINCRTCEHSLAREDGQWVCLLKDAVIPKEVQLTGCASYELKRDF